MVFFSTLGSSVISLQVVTAPAFKGGWWLALSPGVFVLPSWWLSALPDNRQHCMCSCFPLKGGGVGKGNWRELNYCTWIIYFGRAVCLQTAARQVYWFEPCGRDCSILMTCRSLGASYCHKGFLVFLWVLSSYLNWCWVWLLAGRIWVKPLWLSGAGTGTCTVQDECLLAAKAACLYLFS